MKKWRFLTPHHTGRVTTWWNFGRHLADTWQVIGGHFTSLAAPSTW